MQPSARRSTGVSFAAHTAVSAHSGWHPPRKATSNSTAVSACWLLSRAIWKLSICFGCDRHKMCRMTIQTLHLLPAETESYRPILHSIWAVLRQHLSAMGLVSNHPGNCRLSSPTRSASSHMPQWLIAPCWRKKRDSNRCCLSLSAWLTHRRGATVLSASASY
jgi:hypothetical protein